LNQDIFLSTTNPTTREINKKTATMSAMDLDAPVPIAPQARDQHNNAT